MIVNPRYATPEREHAPETAKAAFCDEVSGLRYYNPTEGRWLSRDPIEENGGVNLYATLRNDLTNKSDPVGLVDFRVKYGECTGTITVYEYKLQPTLNPLQAQLRIGAIFLPDHDSSCCCKSTNWIQVTEVSPGKLGKAEGPMIDMLPSAPSPYYKEPFGDRFPGIGDTPHLLRKRSKDAKQRITFRVETCLACKAQGRPDRILGCIEWGFSFSENQSDDSSLPLVFHTAPSDFWKNGLKSDNPNYTYTGDE